MSSPRPHPARSQPRRDRSPRHPHRPLTGIRTWRCTPTGRRAPHCPMPISPSRWAARRAPSPTSTGKILDALRRTDADAVHPGYGFLSENAEFAEACGQAGITFIGPAPDTIPGMGLKDRAKDLARKAGVPVLPDASVTTCEDPNPGSRRRTASASRCSSRRRQGAAARACAWSHARRPRRRHRGRPPGGRQLLRQLHGLLSATSAVPRHIEIQVFGDAHGDAVHLGSAMLDPAPAPEGPGGGAVPGPRRGASRGHGGDGGVARAGARLPRRRHRGVPLRRPPGSSSSWR